MNGMYEDRDYLETLASDSWMDESEGQLSVDVIETPREIIVRSAIAGIGADELDISVTPDTLTVRGEREHGCEEFADATTHVEECYWGRFSRSVILPANVLPDETDAELKNGILTIRLKKAELENTNVRVQDLGV